MRISEQERREAIASLVGHRGYGFLLEDLDGAIESILVSLTSADTEEKVLRCARLFQVFNGWAMLLKTVPEKMKADLEEELEAVGKWSATSPMAPPFPPHRQALLDQIEKETQVKNL